MNTDDRGTTPLPRRFGVPSLALAIVASAVVGGGGAWLLGRHGADGRAHGATGTAEAKEQWQCPMHPSIVRDHPGDCPICGMKQREPAGDARVRLGGEGGFGHAGS